MEAPKRHASRLQSHAQPPHGIGSSLKAVPVSPLDSAGGRPFARTLQPDLDQAITSAMASPHSTAGQFSFGPATQRTTTTTITTTTVSLAPLLIQPPLDLLQRDPKQYPLAFSPTPASMKSFGFDVGGNKTVFQEADDAHDFLDKYEQQQSALQASNGIIRREKRYGQLGESTASSMSRPPLPYPLHHRTRPSLKRSASPPSLAEAAELASLDRKRKRPRSLLSRLDLGTHEQSQTVSRAVQNSSHRFNTLSPVTPETESGSRRLHALDGQDRPFQSTRLRSLMGAGMQSMTDSQLDGISDGAPFLDNGNLQHSEQEGCDPEMAAAAFQPSGATATPPILESDLDPVGAIMLPISAQRRVPPPSLITSSQQDASLPSPSLSPVTAAANLARSHALGSHLAEHHDDEGSEVSGLDLEDSTRDGQLGESFTSQSGSATGKEREEMPPQPDNATARRTSPRTLMDIPDMISTFDAMPDDLQNYVIFQLLKRCSKKTLQTVAEVVNPALKCDPFDILPVELGLQITKSLDGKSLCRAAQVSKRWRHLINSDEKAWKDLLQRDDFVLPEGEIERAVKEGWGWQFPGPKEFEVNLASKKSSRAATLSEVEPGSPVDSDEATTAVTSTRTTRLKRKAAAQSTTHKRQKRKASSSIRDDNLQWMHELEKAQGPMAYASAAAKAVPNPNVGLPSLSSLHLFKSIYQRHHMIRNMWMNPECQPHHLAFRAHHRHVVTCLLFDSDRIITGSDDTSINVYDTKTGVLRKKLEGHEGGVWALSCDGNTLVSGSTDRSVRVWDISTGKCLQTFQGHTSTVRCLVILKPVQVGIDTDGVPIMLPEEPIIITGSRDSTLRVWLLPQPGDPSVHQAGPAATGRENPYALRTLSGHHNSVRAIAAHGDTLISGSYDTTVRVWKISTGDLVHRLMGHTQKVYSVVLDHERGRCISGSMDNMVKVWSLETGICLFNLEGHTSLVGLLDLSHNHLVSAAADSTLRIWDPENGNCRATLSAHTGAITCFQHDGQKVISGSDRTLKMWNVETGDCIRDLLTDLSGVWQVRFDERRCVAAVQRNNLTYIEVLDFGASRDGVSLANRGRRIVVDARGQEIDDEEPPATEPVAVQA